ICLPLDKTKAILIRFSPDSAGNGISRSATRPNSAGAVRSKYQAFPRQSGHSKSNRQCALCPRLAHVVSLPKCLALFAVAMEGAVWKPKCATDGSDRMTGFLRIQIV